MGFIVTYEDYDRNTLLHLAAKLAPEAQLELVCGAAFQMCLELLWFEVRSNPLINLLNLHFHNLPEPSICTLGWVWLSTCKSKNNQSILENCS